jgi:four helix bundle protein
MKLSRFEDLECWHAIARDLGYIDQNEFDEVYEHANKTAKMISGMIKYLRSAKSA